MKKTQKSISPQISYFQKILIITILILTQTPIHAKKTTPKISPYSLTHEINLVRQYPAAYSQIIKKNYLKNSNQNLKIKASAKTLFNSLLKMPIKKPLIISESLTKIAYKQAKIMEKTKTLTPTGKN